MPSEPDNNMDELLKTYAKKRRDEADAHLEMHPVTRRLLQAEAGKLRPKAPERSGSWFSAVLAFWPRYAAATTVVVVLGVGAWSLFLFEEQPGQIALFDAGQKASQPESASSRTNAEKKESGARPYRETAGEERESLQRRAIGPVPTEPQVALRDEASVQLKGVADEARAKRNTTTELAANEALQKNLALNRPAPAAPPASASVPAPITAPASLPEQAATRSFAVADAKDKGALDRARAADNYSKLPQLQPAAADSKPQTALSFRATESDAPARLSSLAPAAQPTLPAPVVSATAVSSAGAPPQTAAASGTDRFYSRQGAVAQTGQNATQSRNRFSQVQSIGRATPGQAGTAASVLAEFDFEQTGNRVRVVDADGSVYDGLIEDAAKADDNAQERARRDALQTVEVRKAPAKPTALAESAPINAPAWNFRASGTNRTLQQAVTINGAFYANSTNLVGPAAQTRGALQQISPQQANATLPPAQRIQGRVQVGTGAETQIDAVRRGN